MTDRNPTTVPEPAPEVWAHDNTREHARIIQRYLTAVAHTECESARWHRLDNGEPECPAATCEWTHYTDCEVCGEQTIRIGSDSAPATHDDCGPEDDA